MRVLILSNGMEVYLSLVSGASSTRHGCREEVHWVGTYTVAIPLRAPIVNVVLTFPAISGHRIATSRSNIPKVVNLTAEFTACLPITGAVPLQKARTPSSLKICRIVADIAEFQDSAPTLPASIILVFSTSAGVTTRIDSAVPAAMPASSVAVVALKVENLSSHSLLLENAKKRIEAFKALLVAKEIQPTYNPEKPWVLILEWRREKEDGRGKMLFPGSWRRVLRNSKGY